MERTVNRFDKAFYFEVPRLMEETFMYPRSHSGCIDGFFGKERRRSVWVDERRQRGTDSAGDDTHGFHKRRPGTDLCLAEIMPNPFHDERDGETLRPPIGVVLSG